MTATGFPHLLVAPTLEIGGCTIFVGDVVLRFGSAGVVVNSFAANGRLCVAVALMAFGGDVSRYCKLWHMTDATKLWPAETLHLARAWYEEADVGWNVLE